MTELFPDSQSFAADSALLVPPPGTEPLTERKVGRYFIRLIERAEADLAMGLYETVAEESRSKELWDWRFYSRNPELIHVFGAFDKSEQLVGLYPCTLRPVRVAGRDLMAQHACRTIVHPDHRGGGRLYIAFLRFSFDRLESIGVHFGYGGGANPAALKMGAWVLDNKEMCQLEYRHRRLSWRPALERRLGTVGGLIARLADPLGKSDLKFRTGRIEVQVATKAGTEFDDLWSRKRDDYKVVLRRDAREVDWRWFRNPVPSTVLVARQDGEPAGFAVVRHHVIDGIRLTTVLDYFTGDDADLLAALLAAAGAEAKQVGSDFLRIAPKKESAAYSLTRTSPWTASKAQPDFVIVGHTSRCSEEAGLAAHLATATDGLNWHYCLGDSDFFD